MKNFIWLVSFKGTNVSCVFFKYFILFSTCNFQNSSRIIITTWKLNVHSSLHSGCSSHQCIFYGCFYTFFANGIRYNPNRILQLYGSVANCMRRNSHIGFQPNSFSTKKKIK
ncbi:unnamed protein product [Ceutorhynchus assimilis]|uniref:Uncharacterized protein n=1 Tax=Ceutorhynchus assimilis TaxID=467358 RepID=A0A9N9QIY4_9CUCU|nr:unnamed protein product [Ceutorhynchus assimilis]